jgi:hypothetical protein
MALGLMVGAAEWFSTASRYCGRDILFFDNNEIGSDKHGWSPQVVVVVIGG